MKYGMPNMPIINPEELNKAVKQDKNNTCFKMKFPINIFAASGKIFYKPDAESEFSGLPKQEGEWP